MTDPNRPTAADVAVYSDLISSAYAFGVLGEKLVSTANGLADRTVDLDTALSFAEAARQLLAENRDALERPSKLAAEPKPATAAYPGIAAALSSLANRSWTPGAGLMGADAEPEPVQIAEAIEAKLTGRILQCPDCPEALAVSNVTGGRLEHYANGDHGWTPDEQPTRRPRIRRPASTTVVREG